SLTSCSAVFKQMPAFAPVIRIVFIVILSISGKGCLLYKLNKGKVEIAITYFKIKKEYHRDVIFQK
ncbi:hypothetical protein, partial [Acinetobacter sp.]|uniref:hypothetical protein n=1 Tax=Acinetobacter sp. TaxID=472 RepID=UPI0028B1C0B8